MSNSHEIHVWPQTLVPIARYAPIEEQMQRKNDLIPIISYL